MPRDTTRRHSERLNQLAADQAAPVDQLLLPARTEGSTHFVQVLLLGPYSLLGCAPVDALRDWLADGPAETYWTARPAVLPYEQGA